MAEIARLLPRIPAVDKVLAAAGKLTDRYGREAVTVAVREATARLRERVKSDADAKVTHDDFQVDAIVADAAGLLAIASRRRTRSVVNATGVILHTNLGRARLAASASEAAGAVAAQAVALEYDLAAGRRGDRDRLVADHLCALTGAEAATVVNNNAAAVLLVMNTLADGREVIVSRGELIEIGGSFRIPDILAKSGARLREVGTTNRTHAEDYARAIAAETAVLLKVHTSNYRIVGFTAAVDLSDLVALAERHPPVVVVEDLGAGALVDLARYGLPREPVVRERVEAGADLVLFSGDKLLGGPQCGVIVGKRDLVERIRENPLKRAVRCDKMTLAALEETLRIYRFEPHPESLVPTLRALVRPLTELESVGRRAIELLTDHLGPGYALSLESSSAEVGSGAQPQVAIDSRAIAIVSSLHGPDGTAERFRSAELPIIGRIESDRFLLDLRTIDDPHDLVPLEPSPSGPQ